MVNAKVKLVEVEAEFAGQRLDNFLLRELKGVPKSRVYNILRRGEVRVNKGRAKPDYKLCAGDIVRVPPVRLSEREAPAVPKSLEESIREAVLYEDDGLLIINKPSGLAVHGGSGVSLGLIESLPQVFPDYRHLGLVHALDTDTSGCVMGPQKRTVLREIPEHPTAAKGVDTRFLARAQANWTG